LQNNPSFKTLVTTKNTIEVARELLGFELIFNGPEGPVGGIITETEAYTEDDPACHAFNGKKTKRNAPMFLTAGHIYIYFIYGMHHCLNIVTEKEGVGAAVLIRALQPTTGMDSIQKNRPNINQNDWLNGPSKLMRGLTIPADLNGTNALKSDCPLQLVFRKPPASIQAWPRIGISKGMDRLWRFCYSDKTV